MPDCRFLESIADYYMGGYNGAPALSTMTFVLPNKRSAMFLKQYIKERCRGVSMLPRLMTMRTFINIFAPCAEASDRELLFILYNAYRSVMEQHGRGDSIREFDSFIFWGDMILSDFDDIDNALADADEVFRNLRDVKEIQADYLDDDQKAVIRRVWGESRLTADIERFWLHLGESRSDGMQQKFLYLWEVLADIYREFKAALRVRSLSTAGGQCRAVAEASRDVTIFDVSGDTRYAFVGFNDLTNAETVILDRLKDARMADFFWDTAALSLFANMAAVPKPLKRLAELVKHFPMPEGYSLPLPERAPEITVKAVPSRVAQTKTAGDVLGRWLEEEKAINADNAIDTAVVMPDQSLVIPMLLAVPDTISKLNISMGLPYRTTTFATLFHAIISMQLRAKKIRGEYHFFHEDVTDVLSHPHIRAIAAEAADLLASEIADNKLFYVPASLIAAKCPELEPIFTAVASRHDAAGTAAYLTALLDSLGERLAALGDEKARPVFELDALRYFRQELDDIARLAISYGTAMTERTFLHLFERIFNSRGLSLNGEPLAGLQLLGVLETRAIDFDNVIVLSVNEGTFPRRQYAKTMIPGALRTGYGLPDLDTLEWSYAYCFYRLVARAKRVVLIYDSRTGGSDTGEISRYISQLLYAVPSLAPLAQTYTLPAKPGENITITVEKTPEVMQHLMRFTPGGDLRLSASSLKEYRSCPLSFYLKYVRGMRASDELVDYVTDAQYGTIVHNTIQGLYYDYKGQRISPGILQSWLDNGAKRIADEALRQLKAVRYKWLEDDPDDERLTPEEKLVWEVVITAVKNDIEAELNRYFNPDFVFEEAEMTINTLDRSNKYKPWKINDTLSVNFYMAIDRVDSMPGRRLRFIDFKTGNENTVVDKPQNLTVRKKTKKEGIFQLFTYCEAYLSIVDPDVDIEPVIHPLMDICAGVGIPFINSNRSAVTNYKDVRADFAPALYELVAEIFNPEVPFSQCPNNDACKFCPFISMCGRVVADN